MERGTVGDSIVLQLKTLMREIDLSDIKDNEAEAKSDDENSLTQEDDPDSSEHELTLMIESLIAELNGINKASFSGDGEGGFSTTDQQSQQQNSILQHDDDQRANRGCTEFVEEGTSSLGSTITSPYNSNKEKLKSDEVEAIRLNQELENRSQLEVSSSAYFRTKFAADQEKAKRINEEIDANIDRRSYYSAGHEITPEFIRAKFEADQAEANRINQELCGGRAVMMTQNSPSTTPSQNTLFQTIRNIVFYDDDDRQSSLGPVAASEEMSKQWRRRKQRIITLKEKLLEHFNNDEDNSPISTTI